ncbi:MAG: hypothetical protein ACI8TX_001440 [Hyphomicrobiaceae bacterium]|jgi:hypothetical protein
MTQIAASLFAALLFLCAVPAQAEGDQPARSPKDTVAGYLGSMQAHEFEKAFDFVSSTMTAGKGREEWAKEQQYIVEMGEVKIFGFEPFEAVQVTDTHAKVPNILKSQDKFLNQLGLDEYELYELLKEGGDWKIDNQTLVEGVGRAEFFPGE